jgi:MFS family permease
MPAGLIMGGLIAGLLSDNAAFLSAMGLSLGGAAAAWLMMPNVQGRRGLRKSGVASSAEEGSTARLRRRARAVMGQAVLMMRDLRISTIWLSNFLIYFSVQGVLLTTLVLFVEHRRVSVGGMGAQPTSGFVMAVMLMTSGVVALLIGRRLDRIRFRIGVALPAVAASVAGFGVLSLAHGLTPVLIGMVLLGVGMGGSTVPLITLLGDLTTSEKRGYAVGLYQFFGDAGGSLGPMIGVETVLGIGFAPVYIAVAGLLVATLPLLYWLWRAERRTGG